MLLTVQRGTTVSNSRFLFQAIQKTKNEESPARIWKEFTCLHSLYLKKLESLGFPAQELGFCGMRSGGATAAANARPYFQEAQENGKARTLKMGV